MRAVHLVTLFFTPSAFLAFISCSLFSLFFGSRDTFLPVPFVCFLFHICNSRRPIFCWFHLWDIELILLLRISRNACSLLNNTINKYVFQWSYAVDNSILKLWYNFNMIIQIMKSKIKRKCLKCKSVIKKDKLYGAVRHGEYRDVFCLPCAYKKSQISFNELVYWPVDK